MSLPEVIEIEEKGLLLKNCIRKNYRHLWAWAKKSKTDCFRIYDRELPEYPLAIDYYAGRFCVHYYSHKRADEEPSSKLIEETEEALCSLFRTSPNAVYWRTRIKAKKTRQYEKAGESNEFFTGTEYGVKFRVNLLDYLDTGLFLDHRETRRLIASECRGKRMLNLFAYTCSFSVHAAAAGASFTKSVDMSNTYTAWGRSNFAINFLSHKNNEIIREDCLRFLDGEIRSGIKYDIVIIDPPTISRSKKMAKMFDIQVDYISLINKSLRLLAKGGVIFFSTNSRKFVLDVTHFANCKIVEISDKTIPPDFHDQKIHRSWRITSL